FFPANNPVLLCAIAIDNPRYGKHTASVAAAPAVKNVFTRLINSTDFRKLYDWVNDDALIARASELNKTIQKNTSIDLMANTENIETINEVKIKTANTELLMPDFMGLTGKYAAYLLENFEVEVEIQGGKGKVVAQRPKAGESIKPKSVCVLYVN
ncbi:MAG: PASTA domain-containing protein, partial [Candidatus Marinimicrobia bacterium]|nr:PASTA domain-containing protein [Candidatus Neomarinimicrobiota bacterium]